MLIFLALLMQICSEGIARGKDIPNAAKHTKIGFTYI